MSNLVLTFPNLGKRPTIAIIIDNAPWHCELTDDTKPPLRSWRKDRIALWLQEHSIKYQTELQKSELLELAHDNLPAKKYKVDEEAKKHSIQILRYV